MSNGSSRRPFDEPPFAGELDAEPTRMDDSMLAGEISPEATAIAPEPDTPFLICESGADAGREFAIAWGETTVGRAVENEAVLKDLSVSRRHLRILRDPRGGLRLRDLGSGNGSLLNGVRVDDAPLRDGDRISLGETVLRVRIPGAASAASGPPRVYLGSAAGYAPPAAGVQAPAPVQAPVQAYVPPATMPAPVRSAPPAVQAPMAVAVPSMAIPSYRPSAEAGPAPAVHQAATRPLSALGAEEAARIADLAAPAVTGARSSARPGATETLVLKDAGKDAEKNKKRNIAMIGGAVLVAAIAIGAAAFQSSRSAQPDDETSAAPKPPMEAGLDALRTRRWDDAEEAFRQVPDSPATRDEVERNLQKARDGRLHEAHLASARRSIQDGDPRGALNFLGMISADSALADDAEAVRREARELLIVKLINDAKLASDGGRIEDARRKLTEASMLAPGHAAVETALSELAALETARRGVVPAPPAPPPPAPPPVRREPAVVAEPRAPRPPRSASPPAPPSAPRRVRPEPSGGGGLPLVGSY